MTLALDGSVHGSANTAISLTVALTTANANDVIIIIAESNGNPVTSVTVGGAAATFRARSGATDIEEWYFIATAPLASASIVVTQTSSNFITVDAFGISGANIAAPFDTNAVLPVTKDGSDPLSISTSNSNDFIIGAFRQGSVATPTAGSGWTLLHAGNFQLVEYKIVSAPQTALSVTDGAAGDANGGIADAIVAAGGGGGATDDIAPRSGPPTVLFPGMIAPAGLGWLINRRNKLGWRRKLASGLWAQTTPRLVPPGEPGRGRKQNHEGAAI